jgi:TonB family protein
VRILEGTPTTNELAAALDGVVPRVLARVAAFPQDSARLLVRLDDDAFRPGADGGAEEQPHLQNTRQVMRAVAGVSFPPPAERRPQYRSTVRLVVSRTGGVVLAETIESSGDAQMDANALEVARIMRFTPPRSGGKAWDMIVTLPVTFTARP